MNTIIEGFQNLMAIKEFEIFFKLILIVFLAGLVGYERESWKKPAGFRTYVLVGISAVLVMLCGDMLYEEIGADPTRIPAQLLSGIGFLGAGTILRDGFNVKGLTTAAGLLAVTCIGLIVGAGFYIPAIIATFVVYCVLSYSHILSTKLEHYYFIDLKITSDTPKEILEDIRKIFNKEKLEIMKIKIVNDDLEEFIKVEVKYKEKVDINGIVAKIMAIDSVNEVVETKSAE
ncbi:MAG: MgtC/SapB family protein [Clostridia bacterium]|nr:MgtC/SapB family protein [Clostridia bacterium]